MNASLAGRSAPEAEPEQTHISKEFKHSQPLIHVVVKFARDACPFFFLGPDEVGA